MDVYIYVDVCVSVYIFRAAKTFTGMYIPIKRIRRRRGRDPRLYCGCGAFSLPLSSINSHHAP